MKIAFFDVEDWEKELYEKQLSAHEIFFDSDSLTQKNSERVADFDIISGSSHASFTTDIIRDIPTLKLYITRSTGFDHIDLSFCASRNITVCNIPEYSSITVAEHTFALMLALTRHLIPSVQSLKSGTVTYQSLRGSELYEKTLGIVGVGSIGKEVIRIAKGFRMDVSAYTKTPSDQLAEELGITFVPLEKLLSESDIVSLHVPYTPSTHHLINKNNINLLKRGAIFINTSRGGVVQTQALVSALNEGVLSGIGLDVLEDEDKHREDKKSLIKIFDGRENVIITPHNAFNSSESLNRIVEITIKTIEAFVDSKPINVVG